MSLNNEYARLKTIRKTWERYAPPASLELAMPNKYIIQNILLPECSQEVENLFNRKNLQPYELAVRAAGNSDYLYDLAQLNDAGPRIINGLQLVDDNSADDSNECVVLIVYLEFN